MLEVPVQESISGEIEKEFFNENDEELFCIGSIFIQSKWRYQKVIRTDCATMKQHSLASLPESPLRFRQEWTRVSVLSQVLSSPYAG